MSELVKSCRLPQCKCPPVSGLYFHNKLNLLVSFYIKITFAVFWFKFSIKILEGIKKIQLYQKLCHVSKDSQRFHNIWIFHEITLTSSKQLELKLKRMKWKSQNMLNKLFFKGECKHSTCDFCSFTRKLYKSMMKRDRISWIMQTFVSLLKG